MNWTVGVVVLVVLCIPLICIIIWMHKANAKIDKEYKQQLEEIHKRFGIKE